MTCRYLCILPTYVGMRKIYIHTESMYFMIDNIPTEYHKQNYFSLDVN